MWVNSKTLFLSLYRIEQLTGGDVGRLNPFAGVGSYRKSMTESCNNAYGSGIELQISVWTHAD